MNRCLLLVIIVAAALVAAQEPDPKGLTARSRAYREYRMVETEPAFGLRKVKRLVATIKTDKDDNPVLPSKQYNALSKSEKFTYCMLNAEEFDQNCAEMPGILKEERKIFAYPEPPFYDQYHWSKRQEAFLKGARATVIRLLRETIESHHRVGANIKQAIVFLNADELIPTLVKNYDRDKKDKDILSVLCVLMKQKAYRPFVVSPTYKTLYADPSSSYKSCVPAEPATERWLIGTAERFARSGTRVSD
jgi:hypothetical protein